MGNMISISRDIDVGELLDKIVKHSGYSDQTNRNWSNDDIRYVAKLVNQR